MDFAKYLPPVTRIDWFGKEVGVDAGEEEVAGRATKSSLLDKMVFVPYPISATDLIELEKEIGVDVGEEEKRFLCVSHGAAIYCLDLKRGEVGFNTAPQSLPVVDKLNLCEGDSCPISAGLLKLGPDVLVVKGSDPQIYQLWLVDGVLRISPLYTFPQLRTPKKYPIMEQVGNEIHVMESCPASIMDGRVIPTHEVLDPNNADSEVVSPMQHANGFPVVMSGHLLLGDQIIATAHRTHNNKFYVLDCKTKKWELRECPWTETHLSSYLSYESPICVDRFYKTGCEAPFYLLINFGNNWPWFEEKRGRVSAEAVGVTETGYVCWSQALPQFFEGLEPMCMWYAHVFRTDKRTMCVIIRAYQYVGGDGSTSEEKCQDVLYIATFYVEESSKWEKGCVEVVLKERYIYKVERDDFSPRLQHMSACFLKYEGAQAFGTGSTEGGYSECRSLPYPWTLLTS